MNQIEFKEEILSLSKKSKNRIIRYTPSRITRSIHLWSFDKTIKWRIEYTSIMISKYAVKIFSGSGYRRLLFKSYDCNLENIFCAINLFSVTYKIVDLIRHLAKNSTIVFNILDQKEKQIMIENKP